MASGRGRCSAPVPCCRHPGNEPDQHAAARQAPQSLHGEDAAGGQELRLALPLPAPPEQTHLPVRAKDHAGLVAVHRVGEQQAAGVGKRRSGGGGTSRSQPAGRRFPFWSRGTHCVCILDAERAPGRAPPTPPTLPKHSHALLSLHLRLSRARLK